MSPSTPAIYMQMKKKHENQTKSQLSLNPNPFQIYPFIYQEQSHSEDIWLRLKAVKLYQKQETIETGSFLRKNLWNGIGQGWIKKEQGLGTVRVEEAWRTMERVPWK